MNVTQINYSDFEGGGGGAIAMHRLCLGLINARVKCRILSKFKTLDAAYSSTIDPLPRLENTLHKLTARCGLNDIHRISAFGIKNHPFYLEADILNFHVLHSDFFSYLALPLLTNSKPSVWTLHDMWSFTGRCAYSYACDRWKTGCGRCPYPNSYPAVQRDSSHVEWHLKNWVYRHSNLTLVTPSRWLTKCAQQSMLSRFPIHYIPNGIDTDCYRPLNPEECRSVLGIPKGKYVLMFVASNLQDDRKGRDLLLQALQALPASLKSDIQLLTFGRGDSMLADATGLPTVHLGYISSDRLKSIVYSAADLLLFPTRADNLPLVLQESMACGTPMVAFKVGGVPELVRPGVTGYLAQPGDAIDLCNGVVQLLEDKPLRERMSQECRTIVQNEYSLEQQAQRYIQVYQRCNGDRR